MRSRKPRQNDGRAAPRRPATPAGAARLLALAADADRLTLLLRRPERARAWGDADWDLTVRQARRAGLLGRAHNLLQSLGLLEAVPAAPRQHFIAAAVLAEKHRSDVEREIAYIGEALAGIAQPIVLLKGAAYLAARLPAGEGRIFGDIDILVPRDALAAAETVLTKSGWQPVKQDAYDRRYYHVWMHEIPPMQHQGRRTTIDVHHTIVPPTAGHRVDARRLREAAVPLATAPQFAVLAPEDMVLHSAVHLFNEGEFAHGLRDLDDLNRLLRHFAERPGFWEALIGRAAAFGLTRPLYYALRYTALLLDAPVPSEVLAHPALAAPRPLLRWVMDGLFGRALRPPHRSCADRLSPVARHLLYIRAHYLRMPLRLLLPHLLRKAVVRRFHPAEA